MKHSVFLTVAFVGLSMPAFASTGEFGDLTGAAGQIVPVQMQLATLEDPLDVVHEIFRRLNLDEGNEALYEAEERARSAEELLDPPDEHEEHFEHHFKCHLLHLMGADMKCEHPA